MDYLHKNFLDMAKKKIENGVAEETKTPTTEKKTVRKKASKKVQTTTEVKNPVAEPETDKSVLIYACKNENVCKALESVATENKVEVVKLAENVLDDYVAMKRKYKTIKDFVEDSHNRAETKGRAMKLYTILTRGAQIDSHDKFTFTMKQVVKETTLTWKTAEQLMELLKAFGFVQVAKDRSFKFCFDENDIQQQIIMEINETVKLLQNELARLEASVKFTSENETEKVKKYIEEVKNNLKAKI